MPSLGRLHLITDTRPGRDPLGVLRAALPVAGAELVVQVRRRGRRHRPRGVRAGPPGARALRPHGATCLVNDRLHVALAVGAAGGHVGADDLPVAAARRVLGPAAVLGATARDAGQRRRGGRRRGQLPRRRALPRHHAPRAGLPDADRAGRGARGRRGCAVPVIAIGGVTAARVPALRAAGAYGVAVVGAVCRRGRPRAGDGGAARGAASERGPAGHDGRRDRPDVAVVGAGPIGLAIAWRCAQRGLRVAVHDPAPGSGRVARRGRDARAGRRGVLRRAGADRAAAESAAPLAGVRRRAGRRHRRRPRIPHRGHPRGRAHRRRRWPRRGGCGRTSRGWGCRSPRSPPGSCATASRRSRPGCAAARTRPATTRSTRGGWSPRCARPPRGPGSTLVPAGSTDLSDAGRGRHSWSPPAAASAALTGLPVRPVKGQVLRLRAPGRGARASGT